MIELWNYMSVCASVGLQKLRRAASMFYLSNSKFNTGLVGAISHGNNIYTTSINQSTLQNRALFHQKQLLNIHQ